MTFDITFSRDATGWCLEPHSQRAHDFLWASEHHDDLTLADCLEMIANAASQGLRVRDLTKERT
jgi:hypothetical protein